MGLLGISPCHRTCRMVTPGGRRSAGRSPVRVLSWLATGWLPALLLLTMPVAATAVTHSQLLQDARMNSKRFASYFQDFRYELHFEVQPIDDFLQWQRGDCDDYAILADHVLKRRNIQTLLVHIRLAGMVAHAVCYVRDDGAYLDYNNRDVFFTLSRCRLSLHEIASKVAKSLEANWTSASFFTYSYETREKRMLLTVAETDPPGQDRLPDASTPSSLLVN